MPMALRPDPRRPAAEPRPSRPRSPRARRSPKVGTGYAQQQATRPQTLGLRAGRLPRRAVHVDRREVLGLERLRRRPGERDPARPAARQRDALLAAGTGASSARLYWESYRRRRMDPVEVPTGVTQFPARAARLPRHWVEQRFTDLRYWSELAAAATSPLEQPELFVDEVRAFFRTVRQAAVSAEDASTDALKPCRWLRPPTGPISPAAKNARHRRRAPARPSPRGRRGRRRRTWCVPRPLQENSSAPACRVGPRRRAAR